MSTSTGTITYTRRGERVTEPLTATRQRTLDDLGTRWSLDAFDTPRLPVMLEELGAREELERPFLATCTRTARPIPGGVEVAHDPNQSGFIGAGGVYVEDLPIKAPGTPFRIAENLWHNAPELLAALIRLERAVNPLLDDMYCYLTVQQSVVEVGRAQRRGGVHVDGFQKASIIPQPIQHQLAVTNLTPTRFHAATFDVARLRTSKQAFFTALAEGCRDPLHSEEPLPFTIHLLNAYCPHETTEATTPGFRTFVRFSASVIPFMGSDNTRSGLLDLSWDAEAKRAFYASIMAPDA